MIKSIDYMITGTCNLQCPFCYGPDPRDERVLVPGEIAQLTAFLSAQGIEGLVISGGEPTDSPHLHHAIASARVAGMWVALQSNGTRPRILREVLPKLDWLALPLDSLSIDGQQLLRTSGRHAEMTLALARSDSILSRRESGLRLKIGTVVSSANFSEMWDIAERLEPISPDVWKLHQFRPRGEGRLNRELLTVPDDDFLRLAHELMEGFPAMNIQASASSDSVRAYLIVNPDSTLLVPLFDSYLSFGRLLSDETIQQDVWSSALDAVDPQAHSTNLARAFSVAHDRGGDSTPETGPQSVVLAHEVLDRGGH